MTFKLISAFFRNLGGEYRLFDKYKQHFAELASLGIPIYIFLDPYYCAYGDELEKTWANVKVLEYIEVDRSFLDDCEALQLPKIRNHAKDTAEYMCIQLMKLKVMARAAELLDTDYLAWIDFGIFHMFKDPSKTGRLIQELCLDNYLWPTDKIISPSCWPPGKYDVWSKICWRYCGSFILGQRHLFQKAYTQQTFLVRSNLPRLTWEVNYWDMMPDFFQTYQANHDDTIIVSKKQLFI